MSCNSDKPVAADPTLTNILGDKFLVGVAINSEQAAGRDTSAAAFAALGNEGRRRLNERLYESLRHAHQYGTRDMSRRELRDYHHKQTGEWLELSSVASTVGSNVMPKAVLVCPSRAEISPIWLPAARSLNDTSLPLAE